MADIDTTKVWRDLDYLREELEWDKWMREIPFIQWPSDWQVKAVPPFVNGIIRYWITKEGLGKSIVSVYLDCYCLLGFEGEPYWEVHPIEGDVGRCSMNDTDELLKLIAQGLGELENEAL